VKHSTSMHVPASFYPLGLSAPDVPEYGPIHRAGKTKGKTRSRVTSFAGRAPILGRSDPYGPF